MDKLLGRCLQYRPEISPRLVIVLFLAIALYGCERDDQKDQDATSVSKPIFHIPNDGKLAEKQVADYIAIRQIIIHEVKAQKLARQNYLAEYREDPAAGTEFPYFDDIEKSAANAHNMSYDEFLWIKDTVISTQTIIMVQHYYDLNKKIMLLLDKTLNRYNEINAESADSPEQQQMDSYVEEMKAEIARLGGKIPDSKEQSEALAHNILVVSKFKKELENLEQQALRPITP